MTQHKTNQFWKNPDLLRLIRKQQQMFRTDRRGQQSQEIEESLESTQRSSSATELNAQHQHEEVIEKR